VSPIWSQALGPHRRGLGGCRSGVAARCRGRPAAQALDARGRPAVDWASRPRENPVLRAKPAAVIGASPSPGEARHAVLDGQRVLARAGARVLNREFSIRSRAPHRVHQAARESARLCRQPHHRARGRQASDGQPLHSEQHAVAARRLIGPEVGRVLAPLMAAPSELLGRGPVGTDMILAEPPQPTGASSISVRRPTSLSCTDSARAARAASLLADLPHDQDHQAR